MDFRLAIDAGKGAHSSSAPSDGLSEARLAPAVSVLARRKRRRENMCPQRRRREWFCDGSETEWSMGSSLQNKLAIGPPKTFFPNNAPAVRYGHRHSGCLSICNRCEDTFAYGCKIVGPMNRF